MEEVTASDLPARDKMFEFFARRFAVMVEQYGRTCFAQKLSRNWQPIFRGCARLCRSG
jgi:hypothetical protein